MERGNDPNNVHPDPSPPTQPKYESDPQLRKRIRAILGDQRPRKRQDGIWPYLLIRAFPGDHGVRLPPLNMFWESPDIQVVKGIVTTLEGNTPTLHPVPNAPHTIFIRVWNLGRLAAVGVRLRVYWANPSFSFDDPTSPGYPHYIGGMYLNLSDRYQPGSHSVSRLPVPWIPIVENNGHECLLAKVDSFADRTGPGFDANTDRHVGQRNLFLAAQQDDLTSLIDSLGLTLPQRADVQMRYGLGDHIRTMIIKYAIVDELGSLGKAVMQVLHIQDLKTKTLISAFQGGHTDVEPLQFRAFQFQQEKLSGGYTIYLSTTQVVNGGGDGMVTIKDNFFSPQNISISRGTMVHWTNTGTRSHTVTSNPGTTSCYPSSVETFNSGSLKNGQTFDHTFNAPGTFSYHCEIHGCDMSGTITVKL